MIASLVLRTERTQDAGHPILVTARGLPRSGPGCASRPWPVLASPASVLVVAANAGSDPIDVCSVDMDRDRRDVARVGHAVDVARRSEPADVAGQPSTATVPAAAMNTGRSEPVADCCHAPDTARLGPRHRGSDRNAARELHERHR